MGFFLEEMVQSFMEMEGLSSKGSVALGDGMMTEPQLTQGGLFGLLQICRGGTAVAATGAVIEDAVMLPAGMGILRARTVCACISLAAFIWTVFIPGDLRGAVFLLDI